MKRTLLFIFICLLSFFTWAAPFKLIDEGEIVLDAVREDIYEGSFFSDGLIQRLPVNGVRETDSTRVWGVYSPKGLYFFFECTQPPERTPPTYGMTEQTNSSDMISILIDPEGRGRSGYYFTVLRGGLKIDAYFLNNGLFNKSWNAEWYGRTADTSDGWNAEIFIPFNALDFKKGAERFRLNILRFTYNTNESCSMVPLGPLESATNMEKAVLAEFSFPIKEQLYVDVSPFIFLRSDLERETDPDMGGDAEFSYAGTFSGALIFNPDYAQIEADDLSFNFTRYELYRQERRDFFTGSAAFMPPELVFYSRRVSKPLLGAKFILDINESETLLMALSENDLAEPEEERTTYLGNTLLNIWDKVKLRGYFSLVRRDFTGGFSVIYSPEQNLVLNLSYLNSEIDGITGTYGSTEISYYNSFMQVYGWLCRIDDVFASPSGYLSENDLLGGLAGVSFFVFPHNFNQIIFGVQGNMYAGVSSEKDRDGMVIYFNPILKNLMSFYFSVGAGAEEFSGYLYRMKETYFSVSTPASEKIRFSISARSGTRADYIEAVDRVFRAFSFYVSAKPLNRLIIDYTLSADTTGLLTEPFENEIQIFNAYLNITERLFIRGKYQLSGPGSVRIYETLLSWEPFPKTFFYLGYRFQSDTGKSLLFKFVL